MEEAVLDLFARYPILFTILSGLLAAHGLALFIVNLTETPKDNRIVGRVYRVLEWVAGVTTMAKETPSSLEDSESVRDMNRL